jgi:hypothetical protein
MHGWKNSDTEAFAMEVLVGKDKDALGNDKRIMNS